MSDVPQSPRLWAAHAFVENRLRLELGDRTLRFFRRGGDLLVREVREREDEADAATDESGARRYAFDQSVESIEARPRTPARPLVVRPRQPLTLGPGSRVRFYVSFPVDIELVAHVREGQPDRIERLPSEVLSDTWFGDPQEGVLCFALKSRARRDRDEVRVRQPTRAVCTLEIHNESTEPFKCEKFCLRLEQCKLWTDASGLWTSPVQLRYRGAANLTAIDYASGPPDDSGAAELVADAEVPPQRGLLRRTFF